jgi:hypothetical protein
LQGIAIEVGRCGRIVESLRRFFSTSGKAGQRQAPHCRWGLPTSLQVYESRTDVTTMHRSITQSKLEKEVDIHWLEIWLVSLVEVPLRCMSPDW